mgnify:CR=1 FL=1
MFKKNLLILFVLLSLNIFADSIRVIVPDGLPALSIVNMVSTTKEIDGKKINYKIEKLSDALVVNMLKREGDIAVVPSNFSAQLYNKNLGYKILGTVGWGSFYVVSRENIKSLEELKGKEVYTFGKGLTPDIIFQSILEKKGIDKKDIKINYLSNGNEVASLYLGKKVDTIVIPEPMLSKVLSKSFPGKAIFPFTDLKRQQKAVFTAFCFRISSAYYFVFVMVFLDLRYFSITMIADNARTIPIPVPITGA